MRVFTVNERVRSISDAREGVIVAVEASRGIVRSADAQRVSYLVRWDRAPDEYKAGDELLPVGQVAY